MHNHNGYMASITGAVSGGLLLGILTACLAFTLALSLPTSVIITGFMCLMPGLFVGAVFGCWLALRWGEYPRAGTTARYLASLLVKHVGIVPLVLLGRGVYPATDDVVRMVRRDVRRVTHLGALAGVAADKER